MSTRPRYAACAIVDVNEGLGLECWLQGLVVSVDRGRGSWRFILDDTTGAVECFLPGSSRETIFSTDGIPCVVLASDSSARVLRILNEVRWFSPGLPTAGDYVNVWGGVVVLIHPTTMVLTRRVIALEWMALEYHARAEVNWFRTLMLGS